MNIEISAKDVDTIAPGLAHRLAEELANKAAARGRESAPVKFFLDYAIAIRPRPRPESTLEERRVWVERSVSWILKARAAHFQVVVAPGRGLGQDNPFPEKIMQSELERLDYGYRFQADIDAMSPAQRADYMQETLKRLRRQPGFVELNLDEEMSAVGPRM